MVGYMAKLPSYFFFLGRTLHRCSVLRVGDLLVHVHVFILADSLSTSLGMGLYTTLKAGLSRSSVVRAPVAYSLAAVNTDMNSLLVVLDDIKSMCYSLLSRILQRGGYILSIHAII